VPIPNLRFNKNLFPLISLPQHRLDNVWALSSVLHEVSHNLQADMGLWVENRNAVLQRLATDRLAPLAVSIFGRWHKEIFADLAACLLGGPAVAVGMAVFLSHPPDKVMTYRPGGPHPTGLLRIFILVEMLRRMGFAGDAQRLAGVWASLYDPRRGHRLPRVLLHEARRAIPAVVDEICFQPRRNLAETALASVIRFSRDDEAAIRRGALRLAGGQWPADLPPRFIVGASGYALEGG
jgi:hypothetical protein